MVRNLKKMAAVVLAGMLACAMSVPAFAAGAYSVTVNNGAAGHTYEAYQIFAGDLSDGDEGQKILSNVVWGSGITDAGKAEMGDAAVVASGLEEMSAADVEAFAQDVSNHLSDSSGSCSTMTDGCYVIDGLEAGYYLIRDKSGSLGGESGVPSYDAHTAFILKVVGDAVVSPKSAVPSVDKQVENDAAADGWASVADYAINKSFQFKLTATLPADEDFGSYEAYEVAFNDTMSDGVTFESIASVKVGDVEIPASSGENDGYECTAVAGQKGGSWALSIKDIKKHDASLTDGSVVEVIYNAHLNEQASLSQRSTDANANTVNLQYSNDPNVNGDGELGQTVDVSAWVFTYVMENVKVDGDADNAPLAGAGFKLYADEACQTEISLVRGENGAYYPAASGSAGAEMFSASETGRFDVVGLDAGTYYLKETTTPAGYNTCDNVTVVIVASPAEAGDGTYQANMSLWVDGGSASVDQVVVVNERGVSLPSTGGAGTMGFYAVGGALLAFATIALMRSRREADE